MSFKKTSAQQTAVKLLGSVAKFILLYGGSRCLTPETLILTQKGYKKIKDINTSDSIYSLSRDNKIQLKKVVNKYINKGVHLRHKVIIFVFKNNTNITCSYGHKLYYKGKYTEANIIARRILEGNKGHKRSLSYFKQRAISLYELLCVKFSFGQSRYNESRIGHQWIFKNYDKNQWQECDSKNTPDSWGIFCEESTKQTTNKPYRSYQEQQRIDKFRMGNFQREYRSHDESGPSNNEQWGKEWEAYINNISGYRNSQGFQKKDCYSKNAIREVQLYGKLYKGRCASKKLEAREIDELDIKQIIYSDYFGLLYDLQIEDNHNYFITKDNIISHNSGKSFIIIYAIILRALKEPGSRHLIVRFAFNHAKQSLWHDTIPKVLSLCFPGVHPVENKTDWFYEFDNGSQIWIGGLDDKARTEKVLGNEYASIFVNEASQISYESYSLLITRLAQKTKLVNRIYIDCNPPSTTHWLYKIFIKNINPDTEAPINKELYGSMRMNPDDNLENIPDDYIDSVLGSLSKRQQDRFRHGLFVDDIEGALWTWDMIEKTRVMELPELVRVCIPVDPAVTKNDASDETGIIPVAMGDNGHFYIIGDYTGKYSPEETARRIHQAYQEKQADMVVGETNNGGDYIRSVIELVGGKLSYTGVHASRGKMTRAEPIALLYSQGRVHHYGNFPKLEEEMTTWVPNSGAKSPNRIDALVWGITYLLGDNQESDFIFG